MYIKYTIEAIEAYEIGLGSTTTVVVRGNNYEDY